MGLTDILIAAAVLAAAGWILVRSFRRGGGCGGCSGSGGCARRRPEDALVRLGGSADRRP